MTKFEYKYILLDYKGRGITQEINTLDIDGERIRGWDDSFISSNIGSYKRSIKLFS